MQLRLVAWFWDLVQTINQTPVVCFENAPNHPNVCPVAFWQMVFQTDPLPVQSAIKVCPAVKPSQRLVAARLRLGSLNAVATPWCWQAAGAMKSVWIFWVGTCFDPATASAVVGFRGTCKAITVL